MLDNFQFVVEEKLSPLMSKLQSNITIRSLSMALMRTMPVLLGVAVFSLLAEFPISAVTNTLDSIGILETLRKVVVTLNNLNPVLYIAMFCHTYAKESKVAATPNLLFGIVVYFMLMPNSIEIGEETIFAYSDQFFAGNGMFLALIVGIVVSYLYVFMTKKNIKFKLPETVPPMVAQSFEPIFIGIAVIGVFILVDFGMAQTAYGNLFTFIIEVIQAPIIAIGANIPFMIFYFTLVNILWFFGIHPSALLALYTPVVRVMFAGNIAATMQGGELPYVQEYLVYTAAQIGGAGNLLALGIIMLFFSKSKRFKATSKIASVPVIFNINEPIVFGTPIIMNSVFLIPMALTSIVSMGSMAVLTSFIPISFNAVAAMAMPWTVPWPITAFVAGGLPLFLIMMVSILLNIALYFPFFRIADKKALAEEMELGDTEVA